MAVVRSPVLNAVMVGGEGGRYGCDCGRGMLCTWIDSGQSATD